MLVFSLDVHAQEVADQVDAYLKQGIRAFNSGRKFAAYEAFKKAEALAPTDPHVLSNLARMTEILEKYDEAVIYWTAYLANHADDIAESLKEDAERSLDKAGKAIYQRSVLVARTEPAKAWVKVNGFPVGTGGEVRLALSPEKEYMVSAELLDHEAPPPYLMKLEPREERTHIIPLKSISFYGTIQLEIYPKDGVDLYIDTKRVGTASSSFEVLEGRHLFCFSKEGYHRWWRYLDIERAKPHSLKVFLRDNTGPTEPCDVEPPPEMR